MPSEEFLKQLYEPSTYSSSLVSHHSLVSRCARSVAKHVDRPAGGSLSILDYGGADGSLGLELRRVLMASSQCSDAKVTVVDLYARDEEPHLRFMSPAAFKSDATKYDLVMAGAVLEHLPGLRDALSDMFAAAKPGALFYSRTPFDLPLAQVVPTYRIKWPRHLYDLGPDFWNKVPQVFGVDAQVLVSRPSLVETSIKSSPLRTVAAHLLKLPGHFEESLRHVVQHERHWWRWVGGWEVLLKIG